MKEGSGGLDVRSSQEGLKNIDLSHTVAEAHGALGLMMVDEGNLEGAAVHFRAA